MALLLWCHYHQNVMLTRDGFGVQMFNCAKTILRHYVCRIWGILQCLEELTVPDITLPQIAHLCCQSVGHMFCPFYERFSLYTCPCPDVCP